MVRITVNKRLDNIKGPVINIRRSGDRSTDRSMLKSAVSVLKSAVSACRTTVARAAVSLHIFMKAAIPPA